MGYRALAYADLQATDGHERCFRNSKLPLQLYRVAKFYADLWRIFQEQKCDCLWDLGDTTDDRSYLPMTGIDAVMAGLEPFPSHELNIKLIGNHEQYLRDTTVHIGRMFAHKFAVVSNCESFDVEDTLVACAAYPASDHATAEWLSKTAYAYRNYERRLLLGHFQVVGAELNSGKALVGIPTAAIEKYTLSLLGHVHRPQQVGRNGFYVGSPFQQNFGEKNEEKRVAIVDTDTLDVVWIPMEDYPRYRVVSFRDWFEMAQADSEDRCQVMLANAQEAEEYYKHPLMGQAEPIYDYQLSHEAQTEIAERRAWTQRDVMARWMREKPPKNYGINSLDAEVMEVGNWIASESNGKGA